MPTHRDGANRPASTRIDVTPRSELVANAEREQLLTVAARTHAEVADRRLRRDAGAARVERVAARFLITGERVEFGALRERVIAAEIDLVVVRRCWSRQRRVVVADARAQGRRDPIVQECRAIVELRGLMESRERIAAVLSREHAKAGPVSNRHIRLRLEYASSHVEPAQRNAKALALALIKRLQEAKQHETLVFPSPRGKVLSDMTLTALLRRVRAKSDTPGRVATAHGFRSSFRDWASESGYARDLAERALVHTVANKVEAAYHCTDLPEQRRPMTEAWASHIICSC